MKSYNLYMYLHDFVSARGEDALAVFDATELAEIHRVGDTSVDDENAHDLLVMLVEKLIDAAEADEEWMPGWGGFTVAQIEAGDWYVAFATAKTACGQEAAPTADHPVKMYHGE